MRQSYNFFIITNKSVYTSNESCNKYRMLALMKASCIPQLSESINQKESESCKNSEIKVFYWNYK